MQSMFLTVMIWLEATPITYSCKSKLDYYSSNAPHRFVRNKYI